MNKKIIVTIIGVLIIIGLALVVWMSCSGEKVTKRKIEIKTNKETIYELFNNFPESKNIYYSSENLYSERSIGPTIYQIDILAELEKNAYETFISQVEFEELDKPEIKVNPNNKSYNWKKITNNNIIKSKNNETASIKSIYLDENTKTIYVIAIGGN